MLLVVAIGGGLSLGDLPEAQAQPPVATRLVWDGSVCGSADDFAARVGKRTTVARFVSRGQRLVVRARIERRGDGLEASASIEARGRTPVVRRLASPDCDDALDALALVVAIGIEGHGSDPRAPARARRRAAPSEPPTPPLEEAPPEPPTPGVVEAPTEVPTAPPEAPPPPSTPSEPPPAAPSPTSLPVAIQEAPAAAPRAPDADSGPPDAPSQLEVGMGLSAALSIGVAPAPLFGAALWISTGWERQSAWSPQLVVAAQYQRLDGLTRLDGRADFALSSASVSLCPARLGNAVLMLRPCAFGALGRLDVEGHSTFEARSWQRPWRAVGGTLEGTARAGIVEFRAVLGATTPLVRDSFLFEGPCADSSVCQADVFHHVAPVIWSGALGAGIRIW